jgi:protein-S-isoprenylcysteine O-methyltransferase Ste14
VLAHFPRSNVFAERALGRQWSVAAQVVDVHQLVKDGAYAIVRHPIYPGILGMMVSTGLALGEPLWLAIAGLVAWYGTHLRIQREEALLKDAFGETYEEYVRKVPALMPAMRWIR